MSEPGQSPTERPRAGRRSRLQRIAAAVTSRRGRWVVIGIWIPLLIAGLIARSHIDQVTSAGQSSYLPTNAESTRVVDSLQQNFKGGDDVPVIVVFERKGGLTKADLGAIGRIGNGLGRLRITGATPVIDPFSAGSDHALGSVAKIARGIGPISRDGEAALLVLAINADDRGAIVKGVGTMRRYLGEHHRAGLRTYVTGPGGIAADLERVADEAGQTLLIATLSLVLILLLLVYRAPILAVLPLLVVGAAYVIALGIAYSLIKAGWITVNTEGTLLLLVLIFGAGTDYSLLLVHRYREELAKGGDPALALPTALAESAPAISASAGTVMAAMLVLLVADLESTRWLGPMLSIGIGVMLVASLTLLPAILSLLGERAFWPVRHVGARGPSRAWTRVAGQVRRRSPTIVVAVCAGLLVLAAGNLVDHDTIGFGQGETNSTESARGTAALNSHFPPGLGSPLTVLVGVEKVEAALKGLKSLRVVQLALPGPPSSASGEAVVVVVLHGNPYAGEAAEDVELVRDRLQEIDPGALVGGIPAENLAVEKTNARDTKLIVPAVLLVVGLILIGVLRALAAPGYLILTVVASFAATLGLVTFAFTEIFGAEGISFNLVLLAFIFLVALGVDYNIFLMARAREEARARGTREGSLVALVNTGGVVTGAGLIVAGTFATLILLPLEELVQIGATVALGVLLDTFAVRALLIPSITYLLGDRAWWPGKAKSELD
jgi:RND superfamily putative drug exporter